VIAQKFISQLNQEIMMSELETFRAEARAWLEENCPAEMRTPAKGDEDVCWGGRNFVFQSDAQKLWLERCVAKGYTVPDWPKAYGGAGLSPQETKVLRQEMAKLGCRSPLNSFGIWMLGPALLKFGTEEQKVHYMGQIARGEIRWCQGYSEPGSGSDLVSMQTFGEDKGDHWVVNGQKIWTSYADKADWIFCLVRTDKTNKYQGISFLLFDMETPGVTTKPIKLISGNSPFCETFFDNVVVPKHQIVGELNAVLTEEPVLRAQMALFDVENLTFRAHGERFMDEWKTGKAHPAYSNLMKYVGTELNKKRNELVMSIGGTQALEWESERSNGGSKARNWLRTKANSIEGGTSEVMLNVVSKRILEMPGA
jgi:acyl-CoA dehydrogenase